MHESPPGLARRGPGTTARSALRLEVEGRRPRDPRSLPVRAVVHPSRDAPQVRLGDPPTLGCRPQPDDPDRSDVVVGQLPDRLAQLDLLLLRHAERLAEVRVDLLQVGNLGGRLLPLLAVRLEPLGVERAIPAYRPGRSLLSRGSVTPMASGSSPAPRLRRHLPGPGTDARASLSPPSQPRRWRWSATTRSLLGRCRRH